MFRLNIRTLKSLSWLAVVLAFAWAGFIFWDIYEGKEKEGRYEPRLRSVFVEILESRTDEARDFRDSRNTYGKNDQEKPWLVRTDGSVKPKPKPPESEKDKGPKQPVEKPLEKLSDVINVSMVVWSNDPLDRFVAVRYAEDAKEPSVNAKSRRLHLSPGDPLRSPYDAGRYNGKVLSIDKQAVTFSWGGEEVTLNPPLGRDGEGERADLWNVRERPDVLAEFGGARPAETQRLSDGSVIIGTNDIDVFRSRGAEIFESIGPRTVTPKNSSDGMVELTNVPEDSIIRSYGFKSGDRIISVNGIPMSSTSQAWNWYEQNPDLPSYHVKYESSGQEKSTTIHNPQG